MLTLYSYYSAGINANEKVFQRLEALKNNNFVLCSGDIFDRCFPRQQHSSSNAISAKDNLMVLDQNTFSMFVKRVLVNLIA